MSQRGDSSIQPDGALTRSDQETQEHAKCRGALLGYCRPPGVASLQNERSQPAGIKAAWPLSELPEQLANVDAVLMEGHFSRAAQATHPLTEGRQESGIVNCWACAQRDDPGVSQVGQEQARTLNHSRLFRMAVM